tara:strand:+ start:41 stop:526 length:486 start_codon:yes stop_codon:yes gene_type:complete
VAIEDLPMPTAEHSGEEAADDADALKFGDVAIGESKSISFTLRNLSSTARKFSWQSVEGLTFSPSVGHLLPKSAKIVTATFAPTEATTHEAAPASLELQRIQYTAEYWDDWDDSMKVVKYLTEEEFQARELTLALALALALTLALTRSPNPNPIPIPNPKP